jgi:hypothetical protein
MPVEIDERDLIFSFDSPLKVERFDDERTHGMGHLQASMKRVDFIVTFPQQTWLIEVKDPENRTIPPHRAAAQRQRFRRRMYRGSLYSRELAPKLKDTLVYLTLAQRAPANEIRYVVLLGLARLDAAMLLTAQDKLRRLCFLPGPFQRDWPSRFAVMVFDIESWNRNLTPHSVRRRP